MQAVFFSCGIEGKESFHLRMKAKKDGSGMARRLSGVVFDAYAGIRPGLVPDELREGTSINVSGSNGNGWGIEKKWQEVANREVEVADFFSVAGSVRKNDVDMGMQLSLRKHSAQEHVLKEVSLFPGLLVPNQA